MDLTNNFVGKEVRRILFSLKKASGEYYHIFSIYENIDEDMQDYRDFAPNHRNEYNDFVKTADGKEDKLYLTIDRVTMTEPFFTKPWENLYSGKTKIISEADDFLWSTENQKWRITHSDGSMPNEIAAMLPRRHCPSYVRCCIPQKQFPVLDSIMSDKKLNTQLSELSKRNLGYDLAEHRNYLGGYIFLTYNDIYRKLSFKGKKTRTGIFCRIDYKNKQSLTCYCKRRGHDNEILGITPFILDGNKNLYEIDFGGTYHSLEVDITDQNGDIIDYYERLTFIHSIHFDVRVGDKEVHVVDEEGKSIRVVQKYIEADKIVIGENVSKGWIDSSPEYSYRKFEEALDFVFYDGDKDNKDANIKKADRDILCVLNSARNKIYICDVFFDEKSLNRFILPMDSRTIPVRILSSKKELKSDGRRRRLANAIKKMHTEDFANIECRVLTGKKAELHDRFIVADDNVWMLGCSLNEFGSRATTLIRVPKDYRKKLIDRAELWWNDNNLTENINNIENNDNPKQRCIISKWLNKLCKW